MKQINLHSCVIIMTSDFNLQLSKAYKEHSLFKELDEMMQFYDGVSDRAFYFLPSGTKGFVNYETYYFMSIKGTLESIKALLQNGRINDSLVLVRKKFDDILTEIYLTVILKEKFDITKSLYVEDVQKWLESSFRIPSLKKILKTIETSSYTKYLYPFFGWRTYLEHNRQFLDDSVHANKYSRVLYNCNTVCLKDKREKFLSNISVILNQLMMIQVSFIFHLNPAYLMASDYMDYMELSLTPPDGAVEWIAPFAQEAFDRYIKQYDNLASFIKATCSLQIQ